MTTVTVTREDCPSGVMGWGPYDLTPGAPLLDVPVPRPVTFAADGTGAVAVEPTPTDGSWCWKTRDGDGRARWVLVPDVPQVAYDQLRDVPAPTCHH